MPTERQIRYWGRAGLNFDRRTAVVCPLCPFRATAKDQDNRSTKLNYDHYKAHHPGLIPSGVPLGERQPSLLQPVSGKNFHWECPLCEFGVLAQDAFSKSASAFTADKVAHCAASHPKVSWKKFKALDRKRTLDKAAVTRRGREGIKRLGAAKGTDLEGFRLFCWPRATPSKVFAGRGGLKSSFGWVCLRCQSPFRRASDATSHGKRGLCCPAIAKRKAARRVAAIEALSLAHVTNTPEGPVKQRESALLDSAKTSFQLPFSSD